MTHTVRLLLLRQEGVSFILFPFLRLLFLLHEQQFPHETETPSLSLTHTHTYTHHRNRNEELHQTLTTKRPCCCVSFFFYLSKSSRSRKTPTARGKAYIKCPSRGYSTPGGGRSRSAHVTFSGNQNLSLQIQAEM